MASSSSKRDFTISSGGLYVGIFASEPGQQFLLYLEDVAATCFRTLKNAATNLFDNASRSLPLIFAQVANWDAAIRHEEAQKAIGLYKDIEVVYKAVLMDYANQIISAAPIAESLGKSADKRRIRLKLPGFAEFLFEFMRILACSELVQSLRYFDSTHFVERKLAIMDAIRTGMAKCLQGRIEFSTTGTSLSKTNSSISSAIDHPHHTSSSSLSASIATPYPNVVSHHHQYTHTNNISGPAPPHTNMPPGYIMNNNIIHALQHQQQYAPQYLQQQQQQYDPNTSVPPSLEFSNYRHPLPSQDPRSIVTAQPYVSDDPPSARDASFTIPSSGTSSRANNNNNGGGASRSFQPVFHAHRPSNMAESASAFAQSFAKQQQTMGRQQQQHPPTIESASDKTGGNVGNTPQQQQPPRNSSSTTTPPQPTVVASGTTKRISPQHPKQQNIEPTSNHSRASSPASMVSAPKNASTTTGAVSLPNTPLMTAVPGVVTTTTTTKPNEPSTATLIPEKQSGGSSITTNNTRNNHTPIGTPTTAVVSANNNDKPTLLNDNNNSRALVDTPIQHDSNNMMVPTIASSASNEPQMEDMAAAAATPLIHTSSSSKELPPTPQSAVQRKSSFQPRPAPVGVASNNNLLFENVIPPTTSAGGDGKTRPKAQQQQQKQQKPSSSSQRFPPKFNPGSIGLPNTEEPEYRVITVKKPSATAIPPPQQQQQQQQYPFMVPIPQIHGSRYDAEDDDTSIPATAHMTNNKPRGGKQQQKKKGGKKTQQASLSAKQQPANLPMFMMMPPYTQQQRQHPRYYGGNEEMEEFAEDNHVYYDGEDDDE